VSKKNVALVCDGMNVLHRGFYASFGFNSGRKPQDLSEQEVKTFAARGMVNILLADLKRIQATHCAIVFDRPGENFRHRLYPEYKAGRPILDGPSMRQVVLPTKKLLNALGIRVFGTPGIEGDDLIGSLAVNLSKQAHTYISSNDKDFAALVTKRLHLLKPKGLILDEKGVLETYGVHPKQMIDYLMLLGDSIDNIPGVNKVGPKTAAKWLAEHGTLKAICRDATFTKSMQQNFDAARKQFDLTRKLITIDTSHLAHVDLDSVRIKGPQPDLKAICDDLDFKSTYTMILNHFR